MTKIRRVDFDADEWLAGTATLDVVDVGIFAVAEAMIYSHGGPIEKADLKRFVRCHGKAFENAFARLVASGRLILNGSEVSSKRCLNELEKARKRIAKWSENGSKGGRPSNKPNGLDEPSGSYARASTSQPIRDTKNQPSQPSLSPSPARAREAEPPEVPTETPPGSRARESPEGAGLAGCSKISEEWIEEARAERVRLGLPEVDVRLEASKAMAHWTLFPPDNPHAAWLGRIRIARNNAGCKAAPIPWDERLRDRPKGPPPPLNWRELEAAGAAA
jgi:uncharacterized protein YdaU (DUF1376 family)